MYKNIASLFCIPETNRILYVNLILTLKINIKIIDFKGVKRVNPKTSHHKEVRTLFSTSYCI